MYLNLVYHPLIDRYYVVSIFLCYIYIYKMLLYIPYILMLLILQNIFPTVRMLDQSVRAFKIFITTARTEKS